MAIKVVHTKVSTIPDGDDTSVVRPSDWNADHALTGLGTMAEQNANAVAITGGTISGVTIPASNLTGTVDVAHGGTGATTLTGYVKGAGTSALTASSTIPNTDITGLGTASTKDAGVALGVATLDAGGTVPLSQIPASIIGGLNYQGAWNANTNTPTLTSSVGTKGYYYVVSVAGTTNLNGITDWQVNDLAVFNGSVWQKIDNTDSVTSVNGQTGAVSITLTGLGAGTIATQNSNNVAITGGTIDGTTIGGTTPAVITGSTINANTKVVSPDFYAQSVLGGNLRTSSGTSLVNWDGGGSGNVTINGGLLANPSNKNISLAPTGTGSVTVNPATTGAIDNMVIGATTPKAINGTTITATSFVGSGASLTNVVNSLTASTGISVSGSTGAVTVTNTAPDQTVALASGTGINVTGTYPNFTVTNTAPSSGGTVTSVTATSPVASTGGTTPVISMPAATTSVSGYLTSTDWNTFNGKQPAGTYVNSVSGTTNQITASTTTGAVTLSLPSSVTTGQFIANQAVSGSSTKGAFAYGTLGYSDSNHLATFQTAVNAYAQVEIQNTQAGTAASADMIVANDLTTASTYYGDFGINSSLFSGTGSLGLANATYLTATTGDLAIGTTTSNAIHFVIAGGATDAMTISTAGNVTVTNTLTATKYVGVSGGTF